MAEVIGAVSERKSPKRIATKRAASKRVASKRAASKRVASKRVASIFSGGVGALVATLLAVGGLVVVQVHRAGGEEIGAGIPVWVADLAFLIAFGLIALRLVWRTGNGPGKLGPYVDRALASLGIVAGIVFLRFPSILEGHMKEIRKELSGSRIDYVLMDTSKPLDTGLFSYLAARIKTQ